MSVSVEPSFLLAVFSLFISVILALLTREKYSKDDAVKLENRLSTIEEILRSRLDPIWNVIMTELPKVLISPHTPEFDELIKKAINNFDLMDNQELLDLERCLVKNHLKHKNVDKKLAARFLLSVTRTKIKQLKGVVDV